MKAEGMSFRAFASLIGVDPKAVRKAVATGRLRESVAYRWKCVCGYRWEAVGLGPDDPGPEAVHDCPRVRALIKQLAREQAAAGDARPLTADEEREWEQWERRHRRRREGA